MPQLRAGSDGTLVAKVADFGTARNLAPTIAGRTVDNPIWLAPEVMRNEEYTEKVSDRLIKQYVLLLLSSLYLIDTIINPF